MRKYNIVMSLTRLGIKDDCAGGSQQQFTKPEVIL
jgi:hypothetical protein